MVYYKSDNHNVKKTMKKREPENGKLLIVYWKISK